MSRAPKQYGTQPGDPDGMPPTDKEHDEWVKKHGRSYTETWFPGWDCKNPPDA